MPNYYFSVHIENQPPHIFFFNHKIDIGTKVVVESNRGIEIGTVGSMPYISEKLDKSDEFLAIYRLATERDLLIQEANSTQAKNYLPTIRSLIRKHRLNMKIFDVAFTLDASKIMLTYSADDRVDFRELLKDLASLVRCRIDLRQKAPRDRARSIGGVGVCGLSLCCQKNLSEFESISLKFLKNQGLSYDTSKYSGVCGLLVCCLKFEESMYNSEKEALNIPPINTHVFYNKKEYKLIGFNIFDRTVRIYRKNFEGGGDENIIVSSELIQWKKSNTDSI